MIRYFGYGSNINLAHLRSFMTRHGVDPEFLTSPAHAILSGYCFRTNYLSVVHGAGAANIEPAGESAVEGVAVEITPDVQKVLRKKEGWPKRYDELEVRVTLVATGAMVPALTYIVTPQRRLDDDLPVTKRYRSLILHGAADLGFSAAYQKQLRAALTVQP